LINLYWPIGENISNKMNSAEWGESVFTELANYIKKIEPNLKAFSVKNIWRMKQFYETYKGDPKLSTLLREISWSHNLAIFSRCKNSDERLFYVEKCINENYSFRELERQISSSLFERRMIGNSKLSPPVREILDAKKNVFKDSFVFEFLSLPEPHNEASVFYFVKTKTTK
jgi:predicted nuclease of restriction endonuclease-like (RecB) superfamily